MEDMDINALVQKHNVIDTIVNVIDQAFIVLIAIAKIVIINRRKIRTRINIQPTSNQK
jgi:L-rhamnose isomerase